mgnify:CR=1 FL=1
MYEYNYSIIIVWFSYFLAIYQFLKLYINQSLLWIPLGLGLLISIVNINISYNIIKRFLFSRYIPYYFYKYISLLSFLTLLMSTLFALLDLMLKITSSDHTALFVPILLISLLFVASTVGMINKLFSELR